jgi:Transposase
VVEIARLLWLSHGSSGGSIFGLQFPPLFPGVCEASVIFRTLTPSSLNWYEHPISSGKIEGINNKIGAMTRAAFGYRDEEFLHLKLYSLHESSLKLSGI